MNIRHALLALAFCLASGAAFAQDASNPPASDSSATPAAASATPAASDTSAAAPAKATPTKHKHKHKRQCKKGDVRVNGKCQPKKAS